MKMLSAWQHSGFNVFCGNRLSPTDDTAMENLARYIIRASLMYSHIPNRGEQMVRYYGYYSNVSRGKRQKEGIDDAIPCILEPQGNEKAFRKSLSQSDYEH